MENGKSHWNQLKSTYLNWNNFVILESDWFFERFVWKKKKQNNKEKKKKILISGNWFQQKKKKIPKMNPKSKQVGKMTN